MRNNTATLTTLTTETAPKLKQLKMWWADMHADPEDIRVSFNDLMSRDLDIFLEQDLIWAFIYQGTTLVAVSWVHDMIPAHCEGWIGGWVAKPYRGIIGKQASLMALDAFREQGVKHLHSSINVANRPSYLWTRRAMGFTSVDIFPRLSPYNGIATDCYILTLNPEDQQLAWHRAEELAKHRWPARYARLRQPKHELLQEDPQREEVTRDESIILA